MNGQTEGMEEGKGKGKARWVGPVIGAGLLVFGLVVAVGVSRYLHDRAASRWSACVSNLRQLDGAKEQAAMEHRLVDGTTVATADLDPYLCRGTAAVRCPCDSNKTFATSYRINVVGTAPVCLCVPLSHRLP